MISSIGCIGVDLANKMSTNDALFSNRWLGGCEISKMAAPMKIFL